MQTGRHDKHHPRGPARRCECCRKAEKDSAAFWETQDGYFLCGSCYDALGRERVETQKPIAERDHILSKDCWCEPTVEKP